MRQMTWLALGIAVLVVAPGCSGKYKTMVADRDARIASLENDVRTLQGRLEEEEARAAALNEELARTLSDYREKEQVWIEEKNARSVITLSEAVLFNSGDPDLSPSGTDVVDRIALAVAKYPEREILIEGHTDNVPIGEMLKERYASNWELSSGRACTVLRYLYWKHKLDPQHLAAIGYGEHRPIATNDTAEGRARNRRVVISIGPRP